MTKRYFRSSGGFVVALTLLLSSAAISALDQENRKDLISLSNNPPAWSVLFGVSQLNMTMSNTLDVGLTITNIDPAWGSDYKFHVLAVDPDLVTIDNVITAEDVGMNSSSWTGNITVDAVFLGHTVVYVEMHRPNEVPVRAKQKLQVVITRNIGYMDTLFKVGVGFFVMVLFIQFGTALDLGELKRILLCPIGPVIGFVGQFVIMPVLSFLIGYVVFPDMVELRLGLFFIGTTPGGGASNIFTVILNGNLNLSITMTAISNLAALGMMPLWIFTLGALIFRDGNFIIPYMNIAGTSASLVLFLGIGVALQKCVPGVTKKMSILLKPIALVLIIFITVTSFTINSYLFKLFSWKIMIASSALPWIGYIIGWIMARLLRQSPKDALTIAIETGIQNAGVAIFMLNFTLPQPQADITSAVPVASSMMMPLPLLLIYVIQKCFCYTSIEETEEAPCKESKEIEVEKIMVKLPSSSADTDLK